MRVNLILLNLSLLLLSCKKGESTNIMTDMNPPAEYKNFTYLALGDSYTIGQSVSQSESFPYQLASTLKGKGWNPSSPKVIARTGWTTDELQSAIRSENIISKFDIVTLLIGVNNQFRGYSKETYRKEFAELLNRAIGFASGRKESVFVLSIPDWGATLYASGTDRDRIGAEIDAFNAINKDETAKAGINYVDITPVSRRALNDNTLIASDGLHPSGKMYAQWLDQLAPLVENSLKSKYP